MPKLLETVIQELRLRGYSKNSELVRLRAGDVNTDNLTCQSSLDMLRYHHYT